MLKALLSRFGVEAAPRVAPAPVHRPEARVLIALAAAAMREGRSDDALAMLDDIVKRHDSVAEAHVMIGEIMHARGELEDARDSYTLAICFDETCWQAHFRMGLLTMDEGRFSEALPSLLRAVELEASDARIHNALGACYLRLGQLERAVEHLRRALLLSPDYAEAHSNLGYVLFRELEAFEEGALHIEKALSIEPGHVAALCNWTMVLQQRGRSDEALALCDKLLEHDANCHEARSNRALVRLARGDFANGWEDYESRKLLWSAASKTPAPYREWDGTPLRGKTVLVQSEQGIGDEIMFASCLPDVISQAQLCIVECTSKLEKLYRRSFPKARIVTKTEPLDLQRLSVHSIDYSVAIGSLPRWLRRSRGDFPEHRGYLTADPARVEYWRERLERLPGRKKIGLSWRGGVRSTRSSLRSIPLEQWLPIFDVDGVDFVSLQYSNCVDELESVRKRGVRIEQWQEAIDDYDETAALVCALDLVVSVQTALVHLAGALGIETWALISAIPEWRYGGTGETMPWYPSARLIRQTAFGSWHAVVRRLQRELEQFSAPRQS